MIDYRSVRKGDFSLPANHEAEASILGGILLDHSVADQAAVLLPSEALHLPSHQVFYRGMLSLRAAGKPIDMITLREALGDEAYEKAGGNIAVSKLTDGLPKTDDISYYAKIIKDKYRLRRLASVGSRITHMALDQEEEADRIIAEAEGLVFNIAEDTRGGDGEPEHVADVAARVVDFYEAKALDPTKLHGLDTGYIDINKMTLGLPEGLNIIAARPSHGKTSLAVNIACNVADRGGSVFMASIESSAEQIVQRILASQAKIDSYKMKQGRMTREEWDRLNVAVANLVATRFVIDDSSAPLPEELLSKSRRFKAKHGLDLLIVDHMQLMGRRMMPKRRYKDVRIAVMEVGAELVGISRALHVPVIGLSQLHRDVDTRTDHRPQMSDLAEAGTLEGDAETVMFIYREEMYNRTIENHGVASLIFGKQRDGLRDEIQMAFIEQYTRFEDLERQPPKREPAPSRDKARYTGGRYTRRDRDD